MLYFWDEDGVRTHRFKGADHQVHGGEMFLNNELSKQVKANMMRSKRCSS